MDLREIEAFGEPGAMVYLADCVELMRLMPAGSVDAVFADPPYRLSNGGVTVKNGRLESVDKGAWDRSLGLDWDVARDAGIPVSLNVAPPTRTRSVVKNSALAAAYAGAHRFGVEVFEPATANVLMAALLVHDLHYGGGPEHPSPWQDEAYAAAHGGLWRTAYAPRSALGLAAVLGYGAARA